MLTETLNQLFQRDLEKLKSEINLYQKEENLWLTTANISNSAGNLCLHLVGNLNAFIGAALGKTNYIRHRDLEFSLKNIPKAELTTRIENTMKVVEASLNGLSESRLSEDFPIKVFQEKTSTGYMLFHLTTHLAYHLGQINYHRRLLDN
jgi:uncharacterized damage-inducible protein DinB